MCALANQAQRKRKEGGKMDTNRPDADATGGDTDAPARRIKWTFVAPLGELPDEDTLRKAGEVIERQERKRNVLTLPREGARDHTELLRGVLERARGTEGIFSFQVGEVDEGMARSAAATSSSPRSWRL